jgi:hypothetical protein
MEAKKCHSFLRRMKSFEGHGEFCSMTLVESTASIVDETKPFHRLKMKPIVPLNFFKIKSESQLGSCMCRLFVPLYPAAWRVLKKGVCFTKEIGVTLSSGVRGLSSEGTCCQLARDPAILRPLVPSHNFHSGGHTLNRLTPQASSRLQGSAVALGLWRDMMTP